jgi:ribosomal protein S6
MNQDILIHLLSDKNIYNQIIKDFPGLYSACLIIKQNISKEAISKSIEKILNFYKNNEKFKTLLDSYNQNIENRVDISNDVAGMVIILDKKEESFKKLMCTAKKEKWQYKGIAIVDQFDNIRLYFY